MMPRTHRPPHLRAIPPPRVATPTMLIEAKPDLARDLVVYLVGVVTGIGALALVIGCFS